MVSVTRFGVAIALTGGLLGGCGTLKVYQPEVGEDVVAGELASTPGGSTSASDGGGDDPIEVDTGLGVEGDSGGWIDDFESGTLAAIWTLGGDANWQVRAGEAVDGSHSAQSADIADSQSSHLGLEVDTPTGGAIAFWHMGYTEQGYDYLRFSVDGAVVGEWSGSWAWQEELFELTPGVHVVRWSYEKDPTQSAGFDGALVDSVVVDGGTP